MATTSTSAAAGTGGTTTSTTSTTASTTARKKKGGKKKTSDTIHMAWIVAGIATAILFLALGVYLFFERTTPVKEKAVVIFWSITLSFLIALLISGAFIGKALGDGELEKDEKAKIVGWIMVPFSIVGSILLISAIASPEVFHFMLRYLQLASVWIFAAALLLGISAYFMSSKKDDTKKGGMSKGWKIALTLLVLFFAISVGARINRAIDEFLVKTYVPKEHSAPKPEQHQEPVPITPDTPEVKKVAVDVDVNVHKNEIITKTVKEVEESPKTTVNNPPMDWSQYLQQQKEASSAKPKGHIY